MFTNLYNKSIYFLYMDRGSGFIIVGLILVLIFSIFIVVYDKVDKKTEEKIKSEEQKIIEFVQMKYPDFKVYPSNDSPKKEIKALKQEDGWYLAFIQTGSGTPILYANCFFVRKTDNETFINGRYEPTFIDKSRDFSLVKCY